MDEYIDIFFSPSSWVDEEVKEKSCWGFREPVQPNVLFPTSFTLRENESRNSSLSMLSSKLPNRDISSLAPNIDPDVAFENFGEAQLDKQGEVCIDEAPPVVNGSLKVGNMGLQYDTALPAFDPLNLSCPKQIPGVDDLKPPLSFTEAGNFGGFCEQFEYNRSFTELQNPSSMQQTWPSSSYRGVSALSTPMGKKAEGQFGIPDRNLGDELNYIVKRNIVMDQIVREKLSASITTENKGDLGSHPLSSFAVMPNRTTTNGLSFQSQTSSAGETFVCNGTGKARVRARRGQATDPHSIAERLRREKIAERMKNLQELVPNSTKVDKASMLDDIIEYVKFLQLQVKVLSMSRLGAAEAVIPLITHGPVEACNSLSLSPSAGQGNNISTSPDQIAFEQEVLKLMESNMTMAIQHLQSKGLCLMPIALANALSNGKESASKSVQDKKIVEFTDNDLMKTKCSSKQQQ